MKSHEQAATQQPHKLQLNANGAWRDVVAFDPSLRGDDVRQAAQRLHEACPEPAWRIVCGTGRSPQVVAHMGRNTLGLWMEAHP